MYSYGTVPYAYIHALSSCCCPAARVYAYGTVPYAYGTVPYEYTLAAGQQQLATE